MKKPSTALTTIPMVAGCALVIVAIAPGAQSRAKRPTCGGKAATIVGSAVAETLRGTEDRDVIVARGGDDRVIARGGPDIVCGGSGDDRLVGGPGADKLIGDGGRDRIGGGPGHDSLFGGSEGDRMWGGGGNDKLIGARGGDRLKGGGGTDHVWGGRGGDTLSGGGGAGDVVDGALGDDTLRGGAGNADTVIGGMGIDRLDGGPGDRDVVRGDDGNDILDGGPGAQDIASFASLSGSGVDANLATGKATGAGEDQMRRIEDLMGSGLGDVLRGNGEDNRIDGGGFSDLIRGRGGYDSAFGGTDYDNCEAETKRDCEERPYPSPLPSPSGTSAVLEPRIDGSAGLVVIGTLEDNSIYVSHQRGRWIVSDPGGVDLAVLDDGSCTKAGAGELRCPGPPRLAQLVVNGGYAEQDRGYESNDRIVLAPSAASIPAFLNGGYGGADVIKAAGGNDQLEGGRGPAQPDRLLGGGGSDGLIADGMGDLLLGGAGADLLVTDSACAGHTFRGGPGEDNASFARSREPGVIATIGGTARDRGVADCSPTRITASIESLEGSQADDRLIGDGRANQLMGQGGRDVLLGRAGIDSLLARDGVTDGRLDCGPGPDGRETVERDRKDPQPRSC